MRQDKLPKLLNVKQITLKSLFFQLSKSLAIKKAFLKRKAFGSFGNNFESLILRLDFLTRKAKLYTEVRWKSWFEVHRLSISSIYYPVG